jgi:hypothetical protein
MDRTYESFSDLDPEKDAWITNFYTENHLAYELFPNEVASPEQLRFMVLLDKEPYYYPCSDKIFKNIIEKKGGDLLTFAYIKVWERVEPLIRSVVKDAYKQKFLLSLLGMKFRRETASIVLLPSRLEKRLLQIFIRVSEIDRPLAKVKETKNRRICELLKSQDFKDAFNDPDGLELRKDTTLDEVNLGIHLLQFRRLMALSGYPELWTSEKQVTSDTLRSMMKAPIEGSGWIWLKNILRKWTHSGKKRYLLWMGVSAGEILFDLAMIQILIRMGINVILSVKKAFYYDSVTLNDVLEDPYLQEMLSGAEIIANPNISKKELLEELKSDKTLYVISDGTQEHFNPLLTSVTFARAFKEADALVSRSAEDADCFIESRFQFTRDTLSVVCKKPGRLILREKLRHPKVIRFSEAALRAKAEALVIDLKTKKREGKKILFYSAIVGSIPYQLEIAKKILNLFVDYLRKRQEAVVVINPAEHFEPGMDADDIMYMWEIVQRSGLIDTWRFQTVDDIEKAFELMDEKIPPEWIGKDATYSTGCTMEMKIALEVQKERPEMQIIGPPWEKFLRRKEYGVGKLYDRALGDI